MVMQTKANCSPLCGIQQASLCPYCWHRGVQRLPLLPLMTVLSLGEEEVSAGLPGPCEGSSKQYNSYNNLLPY